MKINTTKILACTQITSGLAGLGAPAARHYLAPGSAPSASRRSILLGVLAGISQALLTYVVLAIFYLTLSKHLFNDSIPGGFMHFQGSRLEQNEVNILKIPTSSEITLKTGRKGRLAGCLIITRYPESTLCDETGSRNQ